MVESQTEIVEQPKGICETDPNLTTLKRTDNDNRAKREYEQISHMMNTKHTCQFYINTTTDIITGLVLAPPTKRHMYWKKMGGVDELFTMPSINCNTLPNITLLNSYRRNLISQSVGVDSTFVRTILFWKFLHSFNF